MQCRKITGNKSAIFTDEFEQAVFWFIGFV